MILYFLFRRWLHCCVNSVNMNGAICLPWCALYCNTNTLKMRVSGLSWRPSSEEAACSAGDPGSTPDPWRSHVPGSDGVRVPQPGEKNRPLRAPGAEPRAPRLQERPRINRDPAQRNRHKQARFLKTETSSQILLPALTNSFSIRRGRSLWKYQCKFFQEVFSSRSFLGVQHHQLQSITDFCKTSQLATQYWLSKNLVILSKWF